MGKSTELSLRSVPRLFGVIEANETRAGFLEDIMVWRQRLHNWTTTNASLELDFSFRVRTRATAARKGQLLFKRSASSG